MGIRRLTVYCWECPRCNRTDECQFWKKPDAVRDFAQHIADVHSGNVEVSK